ncbi:hypothetical protein [Moraxella sp. ZY210820]|uniref:hypothetical protein n=1 Tax=unclassified Moraxella TaxID=2685852 RepID=UPI0027318C10|nr:hypothetical protein [Moraxella sp. ZY210820]WLF83637.1 hypothetical protein LU301_10335 [Moraxella sp. ZY210820]
MKKSPRNKALKRKPSQARKKHTAEHDYPTWRIMLGFPLLFMLFSSAFGVFQDISYIMKSGAMIGEIDEMRLFSARFFNLYLWLIPITISAFFVYFKYKFTRLLDYIYVFVASILVYLCLVLAFSGTMDWNSLDLVAKRKFVSSLMSMSIFVGIISVIISHFLLPHNFDKDEDIRRVQ